MDALRRHCQRDAVWSERARSAPRSARARSPAGRVRFCRSRTVPWPAALLKRGAGQRRLVEPQPVGVVGAAAAAAGRAGARGGAGRGRAAASGFCQRRLSAEPGARDRPRSAARSRCPSASRSSSRPGTASPGDLVQHHLPGGRAAAGRGGRGRACRPRGPPRGGCRASARASRATARRRPRWCRRPWRRPGSRCSARRA